MIFRAALRTARVDRTVRNMMRASLAPVSFGGPFLVVITEVRPLGSGMERREGWRDECRRPERRRVTARAESAQAAAALARAFAGLGMVRAGRQRVKVLAVGRRLGGSAHAGSAGFGPPSRATP